MHIVVGPKGSIVPVIWRGEYFEHPGVAQVALDITRVKSPIFSGWKGKYWPVDRFRGEPALGRNDEEIAFRWGLGAPAMASPQDRFNVRGIRKITFQDEICRLSAIADDGIRVYVASDLAMT